MGSPSESLEEKNVFAQKCDEIRRDGIYLLEKEITNQWDHLCGSNLEI